MGESLAELEILETPLCKFLILRKILVIIQIMHK
jgi:hypothetical protein